MSHKRANAENHSNSASTLDIAAHLEIHGNLKQGKSYFSITNKGVEKHLSFRKRDVELGHIVNVRFATIATPLQRFFGFIVKDTKPKALERTDCENYLCRRHKSTKLGRGNDLILRATLI